MMVTLNFALGPTALERGISIDPSRLIQGLVGGIGFLGAGAIIGGGSDGRLRGVGSSAAIWVVGGVGIACGLGYLAEAALMAVLTFLILFIGDWCEAKAGIKDAVDKAAENPAGGLAKAVGFVKAQMKAAGVDAPFRMTAAFADGESTVAARRSSDGKSPSLHYLAGGGVTNDQGRIAMASGKGAAVILSEPLDED